MSVSSEGKAGIDNFLRNCVNSRFGFEDIVKEATNKTIENVARETIQLQVERESKFFIAGAEVKI